MDVIIEGDKTAFTSKSSIIKFKDYIKKNSKFDIDDLQIKYINYNYKLELIEKNDDSIKFNISLKKKNNNTDNKIIKSRIKELRNLRNNDNNIYSLYNKLKNNNLSIPIPSPEDVKKEPEKYKFIVQSLIKTLSKKNTSNNNYLKYFKLLNEELKN